MRVNKLFARASGMLALALLFLLLAATLAAATGWASPLSPAGQGSPPQGHDLRSAVTTPTVSIFLPFTTRHTEVTYNRWQAEYYNNATLTEPPAYTRQETRVDYDWGTSYPSGLKGDFFSVRWTGDWAFEVGEYTFFIYADDGVRLRLDGQLLIDSWAAGQGDHEKKILIGTAGLHRLQLEYFERMGDAAIRLHWRRTDLYPQWVGEYYNNAWVDYTAAHEQVDRVIQFDWGTGCPEGLSCDRFSVAWEATPVFETGKHRIHLYADEGYQLLVDGTLVKHGGWDLGDDGGAEDDYYELDVDRLESHEITFNFHDQGGPAEARLWIEHLEHPAWTVQYFGNITLSGNPVATRDDEWAVFHDWGLGKAHRLLPDINNFSVRWSGQHYFHSGAYRFFVFADDAVRLWIDGEQLVNQWHAGRSEYNSLVTYLSSGYHQVTIEYYELTGEAEIRFWWE